MPNSLIEITPVRFFKGDKKERARTISKYKKEYLFENDSHFIRCAVKHFIRQLNINARLKK